MDAPRKLSHWSYDGQVRLVDGREVGGAVHLEAWGVLVELHRHDPLAGAFDPYPYARWAGYPWSQVAEVLGLGPSSVAGPQPDDE